VELGEDRIGNPLLGDKKGAEGPGSNKKSHAENRHGFPFLITTELIS
jgi:hypothetical protein